MVCDMWRNPHTHTGNGRSHDVLLLTLDSPPPPKKKGTDEKINTGAGTHQGRISVIKDASVFMWHTQWWCVKIKTEFFPNFTTEIDFQIMLFFYPVCKHEAARSVRSSDFLCSNRQIFPCKALDKCFWKSI